MYYLSRGRKKQKIMLQFFSVTIFFFWQNNLKKKKKQLFTNTEKPNNKIKKNKFPKTVI